MEVTLVRKEGSEEQDRSQTSSKKIEIEDMISEFTFSDEDEKERINQLIDLTVPVSYKVKFNFTPEQ